MKKSVSSMKKSILDDSIDHYCSCVENLLQNLKSKSSKPQNNDYLLNQILHDEMNEDM